MKVRSAVAAMSLVAFVLAAPTAQAQTPITCLAEVDGAMFDGTVDFAGRARSFAGEDGSVVTQSLRCPYLAPDGRTTELVLEWDEAPLGRFRCADDALVVSEGDPPRGRIDHPELQGAVRLEGPDATSIRSMEPAARITLGAIPGSAASCSTAAAAGASGAGSSGGKALIAVAAAVAVAFAVIGWTVTRRRRAAAIERARRPASPIPSELAGHLVLGARDGPLDAMAAVAVLAHDRGRPDLAEIAVQSRRPVAPHDPRAQRQLAGRILEAAGHPTDGSGTS